MARINASGALERAVPLLSLHCSKDRWPSSHGCPAPDAVNEIKPAQGQDVPGGQPGGFGTTGWFSGHNGPANSGHSRLHRLWTEAEKVASTNRLGRKPINGLGGKRGRQDRPSSKIQADTPMEEAGDLVVLKLW